MTALSLYFHAFMATSVGQMSASFLRVAAATMVGMWVKAGTPLPPSSDQLSGWLEAAVSAGAALVLANYFGPWEGRYGRKAVRQTPLG